MKTPRSAAIYARISSDQEGTRLGVERQLADCRKLAESLGWTVGEVYEDNDISAYSGKRRPHYERMLGDIADGVRDGVVAYHVDRLTRRPIELEQFLEVVTDAKVKHVGFVAGGDLDLGSGDGLMVVRMLAAVAANESATKSRRLRRKMEEIAETGRPHQGPHRPYGYEEDRLTVCQPEAEVIRTLVARYLAGETTKSLAEWLQAEDHRTVLGNKWQTSTIRQIIGSPRIAGFRTLRGEIVAKGMWEAIISEEDHKRIVAEMDRRKVSGRRAPRRYLLSGLLRCGRCGHTLYTAARKERRRYVCQSGPDHGGCGRLMASAEPIEELITDAVLYRLDTAELTDTLAGRIAEDEVGAQVAEELSSDQLMLEELSAMYGAKQITAREWMSARKPIEARIDNAQRHLARLSRSDVLAGLVGNGEGLRKQWASLPLDRQHAIIRAVLDHAVIQPVPPGGDRSFRPERVQPVWRL